MKIHESQNNNKDRMLSHRTIITTDLMKPCLMFTFLNADECPNEHLYKKAADR